MFNLYPHSTQSNITDFVPDLRRTSTSRRGPEYHGPGPFCGGTDRFTAWPEQGETGRYWCRQCNKHGDAIQLLRDRDGLSFAEAKRALGFSIEPVSRRAIAKQKAKSATVAAITDRFRMWQKHKLVALTDEYRDLLSEQEVAEIAIKQIHKRPELYPDRDEAMDLIGQRYAVHSRIAELEQHLDILTYDRHEPARFEWWRREEDKNANRNAA